jgi:hypothetical protein
VCAGFDCWVVRALLLVLCSRAAATITAMCLALLATCMVLQRGWLHIENSGPSEAAA